MKYWVFVAVACLAAGACARSDSVEYAAYRELETVAVEANTSLFTLISGGSLLVYVAEIDYQTQWPTDRLYVMDLAAGTLQNERGLVSAAANATGTYVAIGRIEPMAAWSGRIDTLPVRGGDYSEFEYWLDDGGEETAVPLLSMYALGTGQPLRTWFPGGGFARWTGDDTLVFCTGSWGSLNEEGFAAAGDWYAVNAPGFAAATPAMPPVADTSWFERYPEAPWVSAAETVEWQTSRGVFVTAETGESDEVLSYWMDARVLRVESGDTTAVCAGRLIAADWEGDNLVVEQVADATRRLVWLQRNGAAR